MRYAVEGDDLCIRVSLDAIKSNAESLGPFKVRDRAALAMSVGRELCECEDADEQFYLSRTLDGAVERVIESADPALDFHDDDDN